MRVYVSLILVSERAKAKCLNHHYPGLVQRPCDQKESGEFITHSKEIVSFDL